MKGRFEGTEGKRLLVDELRRQTLVQGNDDSARKLADVATVLEFDVGQDLIVQDGSDQHIDFLLIGEVDILVNGNRVVGRGARTHVGEMAIVDPSGLRSATVRAKTATVVARVDGAAFTTVAAATPDLWKQMARELAQRLRQRGVHVPHRRLKPHVFIGCAVESNDIAESIQAKLQYETSAVEIWHDDTFKASHYTLEDLIPKVSAADVVIMIAAATDSATVRGKAKSAPRDNVILELGLGLGACGRERTLLLVPRDVDLQLPSDLDGFTRIAYGTDTTVAIDARLGPAVTAIKNRIRDLGTKGE